MNLRCLTLLFWLLLMLACTGSEQTDRCKVDGDCPAGTYCKSPKLTCGYDCLEDQNCGDAKVCDVSRGRCTTPSNLCQPEVRKECYSGKLHWFDSCSQVGTVAQDCGTAGCQNGACNSSHVCGNGSCELGAEDCTSCPQDCTCKSNERCEGGFCQVQPCGNGTCESSNGENCATCPQDCKCPTGQSCEQGRCQRKDSCGDGVCETTQNENCLSCPVDCGCQKGEVCEKKTLSCRVLCGDGLCDSTAGETCLTCAKDCACAKNENCSGGKCKNGCGNSSCEPNLGESCATCAQDCGCPKGQTCENGKCNTGGGTCVGCNFGCVQGRCQHLVVVISIKLSCKACEDPFGGDPDPYIRLTLGNGKRYEGPTKSGKCGDVTYNWRVPYLDSALLKNAVLEVYDEDPLDADDKCLRWSVDLSLIGKRTLTDPANQNSTVTFEVSK